LSRVLLINPPKIFNALPPLGLLYIAAVLEENGVDVKVVDSAVENHSWEDVERLIEKESPELLGVPLTTPGYVSGMKTLEIAKRVDPKIKTVVGGPHATVLPDETLNYKTVDYLVRAEGENTILDLSQHVLGTKKKKLNKIPNLSYTVGKKNKHNKIVYIKDVDSIPLPARHFVPIRKYTGVMLPRKLPETQIMSTRGCPFQCTFCSKKVFGSMYRFRDPVLVVDEIEHLVDNYKIKALTFYDDGINYNPKRLEKICDEMIERGLNDEIEWKGQLRVNESFVTKPLLEKMKKSGCWLLCWGIETGDPVMLRRIKKAITFKEVKRALKISASVGIKNLGFFMAGNQFETVSSVERTINFAIELTKYGLDYPQLSLGVPYPGTEFYQIAKRHGWIRAKGWEDYQADKRSIVIQMPGLSDEYLEMALGSFYKRFYMRPSYILKQARSIKNKDDVALLKLGLKYVLGSFVEKIPYAEK
jgi:anaerobic magnesium-protoporphyrin IX monomethyl ester cyclase